MIAKVAAAAVDEYLNWFANIEEDLRKDYKFCARDGVWRAADRRKYSNFLESILS